MEEEQEFLPIYKSDVDKVFEEIERGRLGLNKGLPMGFPTLDSFVGGIQRGRYDLVFAQEKAGKSAFVNSAYILNPYEYLRRLGLTKNLKIFYFSLEMSKTTVLGKWIADRLYNDEKILIDPNILFSKTVTLPDILYEKVKKLKEYFYKMLEECVSIIDDPLNPTGIKIIIDDYARANGKMVNGKYVPNNPDQTVIVIIDTAGNLTWEKVEGMTSMKITIDKQSGFNRMFRNKYNYNVTMVMHSNRDVTDFQREKAGDIFPKRSDIKESNQPSQD